MVVILMAVGVTLMYVAIGLPLEKLGCFRDDRIHIVVRRERLGSLGCNGKLPEEDRLPAAVGASGEESRKQRRVCASQGR